ncbi:hypothetical protein HA48_04245 [Pantoea wallisii]|uniref:Bacterial Ig-like domain-containing protein n=1 Tax=Pantoea wallisii TaxID=1076551 RepID=A0A1X1DD97_9GAMM|nr:Ig-like domain-containing protein [Pantoea wallisii]ORM74471.1 hypothetical protein HA48_04245 [Pantoea wallisii]
MNILTNAKEFWTTNPQRTFTGNAPGENGATVEIVVDNKTYSVTVVDGKWEWTPPEALSEGEHVISVRIIDRAGNMGSPTLLLMHVDTTAPNKPEITRVVDNEGSEQGWLSPNAKTDDNTPTFSGSAEAGSVVKLYDGDKLIGSVVANANGSWEITPETALDNGTHSFTVTSTDRVGHTSVVSDSFDLTIEHHGSQPGPDSVSIDYAVDDAGSVTGNLSNGAFTDDHTPELRGSAPRGSVVEVQYRNAGGEWVSGGTATMIGTEWSWTPNPALGQGNWEFRAGSAGNWSDTFGLDIRDSIDDQAEITHAWDDAGHFTGMLGSGAVTDDHTPTLHGRSTPNAIVYLHYRNGYGQWEVLGSVQAGTDGQWQYEAPELADGNYQFTAGTTPFYTGTGNLFNLSLVAPGSYAPRIDSAWDDVGPRQGRIDNGQTDDTTPTLCGKAEANSTIMIEYRQEGESQPRIGTAKADSTGNWTFTPPALDMGRWTFRPVNESGKGGPEYKLDIVADGEGRSSNFCNFSEVIEYTVIRELTTLEFNSGLKISNKNKALVFSPFLTAQPFLKPYFNVSNNETVKLELNGANYIKFSFQLVSPGQTIAYTFKAYDSLGKEIPSSAITRVNYEYFIDKRYSAEYITLTTGDNNSFGLTSIEWDAPTQPPVYKVDFENILPSLPVGVFSTGRNYYIKDGVALNNLNGTNIFLESVSSNSPSSLIGKRSLSIPTDSVFSIDFKGASEISFDMLSKSGNTSRVSISVYDIYHKLIGEYTINLLENNLEKFIFSGNYGEPIGLVEMKNIGNFYLDNINWESKGEHERNADMIYNFDELNVKTPVTFIRYGDVKLSADNQKILSVKLTQYKELKNSDSLYAENGTNVQIEFEKKTSYVYFDISNVDSVIDFYNAAGVKIGSKKVTAGTDPAGVRFDAPNGEDVASIVIQKTKGTYIDNITVRYHDEQPPQLFDQPLQNDALTLMGVEELNTVSMFGHEKAIDTLYITGENQLLDLNNVSHKISSVEIFDITGSGDNTLRLNVENLLEHGGKDIFITDGKTQLVVNGDAGDVVQLADILPEGDDLTGWQQQAGTVTIAGVHYNVFSHGDAELLVQEGVKTELV